MGLHYTIDPRCSQILQLLLHSEGYRTVQEVAEEMNISKRSVYYDLNKINEWLELEKIPLLVVERKKGIFINAEQNSMIQDALNDSIDNTYYLFSPMERVTIIICAIIKRSHPLFIEDFMDMCQVSRNTIINDLKVVGNRLQEYNLTLVFENKAGYRIAGDTIRKRAVFFLLFPEIADFCRKGILSSENEENIYKILKKLKAIEKHLNTEYVANILYSLAVFISSVQNRHDHIELSDMDKNEISNTEEYRLVHAYFPELVESEQLYITLHLLGSRLQTVPMDIMNKEEDEEAYELASSLVAEFSRVACIDFESVDEVEQALFAHLKTSLYRYRYGIQLGNPMLDDIKNEYKELFELTKQACSYLQQKIGVPISDGEIAYITLHFGGFMHMNSENGEELNILIVCPNGLSTGNMLRNEVSSLLPHAKNIDVVSFLQYEETHNYDVVISTVVIDDEKNLVLVHPILTDNDRVSILRKCMKTDYKQQITIENIIKLASEYMDANKLEYFRNDLVKYYSSMNTAAVIPKKEYGIGILNYLNSKSIQIVKKQMDWKEAVQYASKPLLDNERIEQRYVDSIISKLDELGPYMFITDRVVLAHARVEDGSNGVGVAISIFDESIDFIGKEARIVIVLSAIDQFQHIRILNDLITIFNKKTNIQYLLRCKVKEQALMLIEDILEREKDSNDNDKIKITTN